jgi:hypothetical protein
MRIVSSWCDYYDGVAAYGTYAGIQYIRTTEEFEDVKLNFVGANIGFCGEVHTAWKYKDDYYYIAERDKIEEIIKSSEFVGYRKYSWLYTLKSLKQYDDNLHTFGNKNSKIFEQYKCPIFLLYKDVWSDKKTLVINPCLRPYQFFKVKDTYTAFQDLAMFVSNMANPEKPIPTISNADMIYAKGFDKNSFRKDRTKK